MSKDTELQRLEQFVEKLLGKYEELKNEKNQLIADLGERDSLIAQLEDKISNKNSEREQISVRVNKLVDQIEEWEMSLDEESGDASESEEDASDLEASADDDDTTEDGEEEDGDAQVEEEGRVQHNLFSMSE